MPEHSWFWKVVEPDQLPSPPDRMSYSTLREIEACPRRWSLGRSDYRGSMRLRGYPRRPRTGSLAGEVAHLTLQRVAEALHDAGCLSPEDPAVVSVLRNLGGLSEVLKSCAEDVIARLDGNPRATRRLVQIRIGLIRRLPELRQVVQGTLQRMFGATAPPEPTGGSGSSRDESTRSSLGFGFHAEVELAPSSLGWVGVADAIKIAPRACEIIDYKTGEADPGHADQLRIYALLWARDGVINPEARPATHLTIVYPGTALFLPAPSGSELDELEIELHRRADSARVALQNQPPKAEVSVVNCRFCDVKQLCGEYWTADGQASIRAGSAPSLRCIQVEILEPLGVRAWRVAVELDPLLRPGTLALLVSQDAKPWEHSERLRLLDVHVEEPTEDRLHVIHLGSGSEAYLV